MRLRIFVVAPTALLTDNRPHGDGLVAFAFIRELAARGHQLHVAARSADLRGEALPSNAHLHRLGPAGPAASSQRPAFMWRMRRLHRRLARTGGFDLLHQLNPVDVGVTLALADVRTPVVLGPYVPDWAVAGEGADPAAHGAAPRLKRALRAAQQRCATTVLISTPAAASKVEARASEGLNVRELSPGIDDQLWAPGRAAAGQELLYLGNLEVRKGIHVVLDAFARLAPRLPSARLVVAGAGPELGAVVHRIRSAPALERVELLGPLERDEAVAVMQRCDVCCIPSYGEPFGMTALEAMACARPIVATDAGGLRHLLPDEGGRKVPPGGAAALAAALEELLGDAELRRAMGEHNRRVVEERYAWPRVVDRLEEIYAETLARRR